MTEVEKRFCEDIVKDGTVISMRRFICDGSYVETYEVEFEGEIYIVTRNDGEYVYVQRRIEK